MVRIALMFCVLAVGVCAASWFRHDAPPVPVVQETDEELLLQCRANRPPVESSNPEESDLVRVPPSRVVSPSSNRHELPPSLSPTYPRSSHGARSPQNASMAMMLPVAQPDDATARTHTVVDGDTLDALARRYLGSAARADEIFRANREVLSDPNLLPIGAELKLPDR